MRYWNLCENEHKSVHMRDTELKKYEILMFRRYLGKEDIQ